MCKGAGEDADPVGRGFWDEELLFQGEVGEVGESQGEICLKYIK